MVQTSLTAQGLRPRAAPGVQFRDRPAQADDRSLVRGHMGCWLPATRFLTVRDPCRLADDRRRTLEKRTQLARQAMLHLADGMEEVPMVTFRAPVGVDGLTHRTDRVTTITHQTVLAQLAILDQPPN